MTNKTANVRPERLFTFIVSQTNECHFYNYFLYKCFSEILFLHNQYLRQNRLLHEKNYCLFIFCCYYVSSVCTALCSFTGKFKSKGMVHQCKVWTVYSLGTVQHSRARRVGDE